MTKKKQKLFCSWYAVLGSAPDAAAKAGFDPDTALCDAVRCLSSDEWSRYISDMRSALTDTGAVIAGLRRLAFGSCKDAVRLAFSEELPPPSVIEEMDLFGVTGIKRDKGGGVEIHLADRMKALEKLYELENSFLSRDKAESLITALTRTGEGDELEDTAAVT
ncbi:MAG: terminase small subunit [Ruminococcus sp.]|nr:terminase small subunit [Ruminococcus sp.]